MASKIPCTADRAQVIYRGEKGDGVLIVNQENVSDVYIDDAASDLNRTSASATPTEGTKVAKNGGQVQFTSKTGLIWGRADGVTGDTFIRVQKSG